MICSISGQIAEKPVISKYGDVYEKNLIIKYLSSQKSCPHSGQDLTEEDLIEVKSQGTGKPRNLTATSIPSMLQLFQTEWDAMMLETFQLKQQLDATRKELSQALYQHDAACRVIARLMKERDDARRILNEFQANGQAPNDSMETDSTSSSGNTLDEITDKMAESAKKLSLQRKKRQISTELAQPDAISSYSVYSSHPLHKTTTPGVLCLDIHPKHQNLIVTGGADKNISIFDQNTGKVTETLSGHTKKLTDVLFHPNEDLIISSSSDKTACVWIGSDNGHTASQVIKTHTNEVTQIDLHPVGDYFVTGSLDKNISLHDLHTGATYLTLSDKQDAGVCSVQFHPDGLILGGGMSDSNVRIWDVKSQQNVATFVGHKGKIASIAFSENGFYMATAAEDASIKLWDLRKLKNFNSITLEDGQYAISALRFDYSGNYLAVAGTDTRVFSSKSLSPVAAFTAHSAIVTDVQFGKDAKFIATTSMDRYLKLHGQQ